MADRLVCISWHEPRDGREDAALEVFNEAVGYYGRMQQEGRIERFDVRLLGPSTGVDGYMELEGTAEQLTALKEQQEFRRILAEAELCVKGIRVVDGYCNQGVADQMALYAEVSAKYAQTT